jgi:hypothetical protein
MKIIINLLKKDTTHENRVAANLDSNENRLKYSNVLIESSFG